MQAAADLAGKEATWRSLEKQHKEVAGNQNQTIELDRKLQALHQLATNRLLVALPLNALQQAVVDEIQVTRVRIDQGYLQTAATKSVTNATKVVTPGKLARSTERTTLIVEGRDYSTPLGEQVGRFKEALFNTPYLRSQLKALDDIRMTGLTRQTDPADPAKTFVAFTLECRFPEKVR
jgi:hypothetical protein